MVFFDIQDTQNLINTTSQELTLSEDRGSLTHRPIRAFHSSVTAHDHAVNLGYNDIADLFTKN